MELLFEEANIFDKNKSKERKSSPNNFLRINKLKKII